MSQLVVRNIEETVVATLSPPRLQAESTEEIESETELVGEAGAGDGADSEDSSGEE
jgi:hypothetical protein